MLMDAVLAMKDPEGLKVAIKMAADKKPSSQELLAQRVSFVFASVGKNSGVTRDQVRKAILDSTVGSEAA